MSRLATRAAAVLGAAVCVFAGGLVATRGGDRPTAAAPATAAPVRANVDPLTTVLGTAGQVEQLQHAVAVRPENGDLTARLGLPPQLPKRASGAVALGRAAAAPTEIRAVIFGHSLRATDADWEFGRGPVLEATAAELLEFLGGRSLNAPRPSP